MKFPEPFKPFKALIVFTVACFLAPNEHAFAQNVGFEKEYATVGFMEREWGPRQIKTGKALLDLVRRHFNGTGKIQVVPWEKSNSQNATHIVYKDPQGRVWSIDPEAVNTGGLDGLEFVTPPQLTDEDLQLTKQIFAEVKKSKLVMRGLRSSGHITVEVLHLLQDPPSVSDLVDLILTIENHWPEIYNFFQPRRYGTIVNRFAVPLAIDQQGLLRELAAMPKSERTYTNVRQVFLKYDELENQLRNADGLNAGRKWKYRAANYGKLFGLTGSAPLGVIEFRIPDLDFGEQIIEQADFVRRLVNLQQRDKTFDARFGWNRLSWQSASEALTKIPLDTYFMKRVGITESEQNTSVAVQSTNENIDLIDISQPIEKDSEYFTYGFEAEFAGYNVTAVLDDHHEIRADRFPFLDHYVTKENTGNIEIKSLGGEIHMDEVLDQMSKIKKTLNGDLRGFHFRVRIPKSVAEKLQPGLLEAFANSVGDYVFAWRLQNRRTYFALKSQTVGRNTVADVTTRGTVRLIPLADGKYDFEIRGFMGDISMIGKTAQLFITGLMNPQHINTNYADRMGRTMKSMSLSEFVELYLAKVKPEESELLQKLEGVVAGDEILPLYRLEDNLGLDEYEKIRIRNANFEFAKETMTVVRNFLSNKYSGDFNEADRQFRWRLKRWALALDLQALLEKHLLEIGTEDSIAERTNQSKKSLERVQRQKLKFIAQSLESDDQEVHNAALLAVTKQTTPLALPLIEKALQSANPTTRAAAASALQYQTGEKAAALLRLAFQDEDIAVRQGALAAVRSQNNPATMPLLKELMQNPDPEVRLTVVGSLRNQDNADSLEIVKMALRDSEPQVQSTGLQVLKSQTGEKALALIEAALESKIEFLRRGGADALVGREGTKALKLVKRALESRDESIRNSATIALAGFATDSVIDLYSKSLQDPEPTVRMSAAIALQTHPSPKGFALIEELLQSPRGSVRSAAAKALAGVTTEDALPLIQKGLQDPDENVVKFSAEALGKQHSEKALPLVEVVLKNKSVAVKVSGIEALRNIATEKALAMTQEAMGYGEIQSHAQFAYRHILNQMKRRVLTAQGSLNSSRQIPLRCEAALGDLF